jgi:hypothetical protein
MESTEETSGPLSDLVVGIRKGLDDYLAAVTRKAVDEEIINEDQRDRIIALADKDPGGRL